MQYQAAVEALARAKDYAFKSNNSLFELVKTAHSDMISTLSLLERDSLSYVTVSQLEDALKGMKLWADVHNEKYRNMIES